MVYTATTRLPVLTTRLPCLPDVPTVRPYAHEENEDRSWESREKLRLRVHGSYRHKTRWLKSVKWRNYPRKNIQKLLVAMRLENNRTPVDKNRYKRYLIAFHLERWIGIWWCRQKRSRHVAAVTATIWYYLSWRVVVTMIPVEYGPHLPCRLKRHILNVLLLWHAATFATYICGNCEDTTDTGTRLNDFAKRKIVRATWCDGPSTPTGCKQWW